MNKLRSDCSMQIFMLLKMSYAKYLVNNIFSKEEIILKKLYFDRFLILHLTTFN